MTVMNDTLTDIDRDILEMEWQMFSHVNDGGPKASCQEDEQFYKLMRKSQLMVWEPEVRESYHADLKAAVEAGRNLMIEKYAYMMAFTDPEYFAMIRHLLPEVPEEKKRIADRIAAIQTQEASSLSAGAGSSGSGGAHMARPVESSEDAAGNISSETYSRCELWTYSEETLRLLLDQIERMEEAGSSYVAEVLRNTSEAQRSVLRKENR